MNFENRLKKENKSVAPPEGQTVEEITEMIFGDLAECFIVVGYSKGSGEKFGCKISDNQICDEALEALRPAVTNWFNLEVPFMDEEQNEK